MKPRAGNWTRLTLCLAALTGGLLLPVGAQEAPVASTPAAPCGSQPLSVARMQWSSAALLAEIHARVLRAHLGCEVRIVPGDLAATGSSMGATGQPGIAPEMWVTRIAEIWNAAVETQKARPAGPSYSETTFEGWFIPDYLLAANPQLTSASALRENWPLFSINGAKPRFVSCPPDWACAVINRNMLRANGLDQLFEIVEPANRFEMDTIIGASVSRREPILFYYWQPNAILSQFPFKPIELGTYEREAMLCLARRACPDPKPSGFPAEPVLTALTDWVFTEAPAVASYFQRAQMPLAEMNALLFQLSEPGATIESIADRFVERRKSVWGKWAGLPADQIPLDPPPEQPGAGSTAAAPATSP